MWEVMLMFKVLPTAYSNQHTNQQSNQSKQGASPRFDANMQVLRNVLAGNFDNASNFTGMGGLRTCLQVPEVRQELLSLTGQDGLAKLIDSTTSGYFTPPEVIRYVYSILDQLGFKGGRILEPSCGTGSFLSHMPEAVRANSHITGIELEPVSAKIAQHIHSDVEIINSGFEHYQVQGFDAVIGNPPYGSQLVYDAQHIDLKGQSIHHYFVAKAVRLLNDGGLLAMVVPSYLLDNLKNHARHYIAECAELLCAYRLPDSLFDNAKVTVDLIVLQRKANPDKSWVEALPIQLDNGKRFYLSGYFVKHPDHIIGTLDSYSTWMVKENRERTGLKCTGTMQEIDSKLPELIKQLPPVIKPKMQTTDDMQKALDYLHKLAGQFNRCLAKMDACIA
jgi:SAM-dependent methyltransferase